MNAPRTKWLCAALSVALPLSAAAGAEPLRITPAEIVEDPAAAWTRFLAEGRYNDAYPAYEVLAALGYDHGQVDAEGCERHRDALRDAVAAAPVSLALHRASLMCAEALGNEADAEESLQVLGALSRLALRDGRGAIAPRPIRVLAPSDAFALLAVLELEYVQDYYAQLKPDRHFPLVVLARDEALGKERSLVFDFVDAVHAIDHEDPYSGYPIQRHRFAEGIVRSQAAASEASALAWQAVNAAYLADTPAQRVEALRSTAEAGAVQSTVAWIQICTTTPHEGCADGLVDAVLPHAEQKRALPMTLLALLHAKGMGVDRDEGAAGVLLDAADRRWLDDGATIAFARLWIDTGSGKAPEFLIRRLSAMAARGNLAATAMGAALRLIDDGVELGTDDIAALSSAAGNAVGWGYALLARHFTDRKQNLIAMGWAGKAADAGDAGSQAFVGMQRHRRGASAQERADGLRLVERGAQGGNAVAMRYLARERGRHAQWKDAEAWLLGAVLGGSVGAILDLAAIYEQQPPGVSGDLERAIDTYRALDTGDGSAEARRRLAVLALDGRGMDKDPRKAERWLLQDASQSDQESAVALALGYLEGRFGDVDVEEGTRWMTSAIAAGETGAYVDFGGWHFYTRKDLSLASRQRAVELWRQGAEAGNTTALNNLAWSLCTAPEPEIFDPVKGMEEATKLHARDDIGKDELDTVAACHAAMGDFRKAAQIQRDIVASLTEHELAEDAERPINFRSRLAQYERGERHVEPLRE